MRVRECVRVRRRAPPERQASVRAVREYGECVKVMPASPARCAGQAACVTTAASVCASGAQSARGK